MDSSYCKTLDENFNEALNLVDKQFSHLELLDLLQNGNILQKQLAALRLEKLNSTEDLQILLNNLVGQDGKIREVVSLKIKDFVSDEKYLPYFKSMDMNILSDYFLAAVIDVNGNICRNILDSLIYLKNDNTFSELFLDKLVTLIFSLFEKIEKFDYKDRKYTINKEMFKLYWCLEAINIYWDVVSLDILKKIISVTKDIDDYTIREKTAKILVNDFNDEEISKYRKELLSDENYYVRKVLSKFD